MQHRQREADVRRNECPFNPEWDEDEDEELQTCESKVKDPVTLECIQTMVQLPTLHDPSKKECYEAETLRRTFLLKRGFVYPHHNTAMSQDAIDAYREATGDPTDYASYVDPEDSDEEEVGVMEEDSDEDEVGVVGEDEEDW